MSGKRLVSGLTESPLGPREVEALPDYVPSTTEGSIEAVKTGRPGKVVKLKNGSQHDCSDLR
jgi:hypothetical protein